MLDIRHVVAIVLFLINGLWKIIRSGCDYQTLEEQLHLPHSGKKIARRPEVAAPQLLFQSGEFSEEQACGDRLEGIHKL